MKERGWTYNWRYLRSRFDSFLRVRQLLPGFGSEIPTEFSEISNFSSCAEDKLSWIAISDTSNCRSILAPSFGSHLLRIGSVISQQQVHGDDPVFLLSFISWRQRSLRVLVSLIGQLQWAVVLVGISKRSHLLRLKSSYFE